MAKNIIPIAAPEWRIGTNGGGDRVFDSLESLASFTKSTTRTVTGMLQCMQLAFDKHDPALNEPMDLANDLVFQLEQACDLLFPEFPEVTA